MSLYSHKTFISKKAVPIFGGTEILYELELCLGGMFVRTFALRRKLRAISAKLLSVSSRLHFEFKSKQNVRFISDELKSISCRRLETRKHSDRNGDFGFRRKAQVRTNTLFIFIKSVPCKGDT